MRGSSINILKLHRSVKRHCKSYDNYDFERILNMSPEMIKGLQTYISNNYSCMRPININCEDCVFNCNNNNGYGRCLTHRFYKTKGGKILADILWDMVVEEEKDE